MKLIIYGEHTHPYGDAPYHLRKEFEQALKNSWPAVEWFDFNSNTCAEISVYPDAVADLSVRQLYVCLADAVSLASKQTDWEIWQVPCL